MAVTKRLRCFALFLLALVTASCAADETIAPYQPRFGRSRPVIAVVGENAGTVLSDYAIPYGLLARSALADVVSVATERGLLTLTPLRIAPDTTMVQFDTRYPEGADYVFVPAVKVPDDPALLDWIRAQAGKGATMISICNGSLVLAHAGLTRGRRATGHWSTYQSRLTKFPDTMWRKNVRYVVDGPVVSSAGITAAIPVSLALVEAIGGTARANSLAASIGAAGWSTQHDSDAFRLTASDYFHGAVNTLLHGTDDIGLPISDGADEIALALTAEAYSDTLRSRIHVLAPTAAPVRTRGGLMLVPDLVAGRDHTPDVMLPVMDNTMGGLPDALVPNRLLADIAARYGAATARLIVLDWEYPAANYLDAPPTTSND